MITNTCLLKVDWTYASSQCTNRALQLIMISSKCQYQFSVAFSKVVATCRVVNFKEI